MDPLLRINELSVDFLTEQATIHGIEKVSFNVDSNEIVAIVGESGSGKSVTALSILQLLPVPPAEYKAGEIIFRINEKEEIDLLKQDHWTLQDIRGNRIAMIFQEPMTSLNPVLTCGYQVMEAIIRHRNTTKAKAKQLVTEWFERVKLPDPSAMLHRYPHQLSGGQKQRVMIAMAMCCEPSLLICDEPTTALDVTVQKTILELIKELQLQSKMGVIFITHDLGVVAEIADRVIVMYNGKIVEHGRAKEIFVTPKHPYTQALLACRPVNHKRGERLPVVSDFIEKTQGPQAHKAQGSDKIQETRSKEVILSVENLTVRFPTKKNWLGNPVSYLNAVDDVSFDVYEGETLGLVGESGCGKTTLGRAILRLIEPGSGRVVFKGKDLASMSKDALRPLRKDLQIVFQDPYSSLNPRITIGSAILEPMRVHGIKNQGKITVTDILKKVKLLPEHFNRYPHEFSGGQRQRIVIARALSLNPSFLICDESVSALDVSVQAQVLNLLNDLKKEFGFTIIFISHDLSVVRYISDRIMVMKEGRIIESGFSDEVYYQPKLDYTKKLIASIPGRISA